MKKAIMLLAVFLSYTPILIAQDVKVLLKQVKDKYDKVNDYTADGKMKTNEKIITRKLQTRIRPAPAPEPSNVAPKAAHRPSPGTVLGFYSYMIAYFT